MTRNQRKSPAQWGQIIADYENSGMSKGQYCQQHGIGASTLDKWRRRLAGNQGAVPPTGFIQINRQSDADQMQVRLQTVSGVTLLCPVSMGLDAIAELTRRIGDER
jgi:transposase-like protein